jgi:hypothetical protein
MPKWKKESLKLKKDHLWKAKPGYRIFVADRGVVRFNVPQDWIVEPASESTKFYDREPLEDADCRLECSYLRLPPIDWSDLPLSQLIQVAFEGDPRALVPTERHGHLQREAVELAWAEFRFIDPNEQREAFTRVCIGRGSTIQTLITLDYWPKDATRLDETWDEVMQSLELGEYIKDPTIGQ